MGRGSIMIWWNNIDLLILFVTSSYNHSLVYNHILNSIVYILVHIDHIHTLQCNLYMNMRHMKPQDNHNPHMNKRNNVIKLNKNAISCYILMSNQYILLHIHFHSIHHSILRSMSTYLCTDIYSSLSYQDRKVKSDMHDFQENEPM